ncbi:CMP/dCMP kinase [Methylophilaceae bacterium]|nr:CMP/dCMP kinase [Methylophilaceae bacterium]
MTYTSHIPVIAIDGPSASGKGTVAQHVARQLGYHYLDSGALYRLVALAARHVNMSWQNAGALATMALELDIRFVDDRIMLNGQDVSEEVRSEEIGKGASEVAVHPEVRAALLDLQHSFRKPPGLVADGRDMATVVFPDAATKIFLTATAEVRAERRYKQLMEKGKHANLRDILHDLQLRDARDSQRTAAPLQQSADAILLETSQLSIEEAVKFIIEAAGQQHAH